MRAGRPVLDQPRVDRLGCIVEIVAKVALQVNLPPPGAQVSARDRDQAGGQHLPQRRQKLLLGRSAKLPKVPVGQEQSVLGNVGGRRACA
jgi:hypothetical protein